MSSVLWRENKICDALHSSRLWTDLLTSPSSSTSAQPNGHFPPNPQIHTHSRSTPFYLIFSCFLILISPINTKTLSQSLARYQEKGPRPLSLPPLFSSSNLLSVLFYSSEEAGDSSAAQIVHPDPNSYRFFKTVDQSLVQRISREFDILGHPDTEGIRHSTYLVGCFQRVTPRTLCVGWGSHKGDMLCVHACLLVTSYPQNQI